MTVLVQGSIRLLHSRKMVVGTTWMWINSVGVYKAYDQLETRDCKSGRTKISVGFESRVRYNNVGKDKLLFKVR
jgi:hypothetical protein